MTWYDIITALASDCTRLQRESAGVFFLPFMIFAGSGAKGPGGGHGARAPCGVLGAEPRGGVEGRQPPSRGARGRRSPQRIRGK